MVIAKKAIESTYIGKCTVIEYADVIDDNTKITCKKEVTVFEKQPCRISFEKNVAAIQTDTTAEISQNIKLFLSPDMTIKAGSKVIVEQNGITEEYISSGVPAVYISHQEIMLKLFKEYA